MQQTRIEWRAFIGPRYYPTQDQYHHDWSWFTPNTAYDFEIWDTYTSDTIIAGSTSVTLNDAAYFQDSGGAWIGPVNAGESWEYVSYSSRTGNTLENLEREPEPEHNGAHGAGATCRQWWPIGEEAFGGLSVEMSTADALSASQWTARISGANFPQPPLKRNHAIIIMASIDGADWVTAMVGFISDINANQAGERKGTWDITVVSIAGMLALKEVEGRRHGDVDLAKQGAASSNSVMVGSYKERHSGDYTQAEPTFDAANTIDDNEQTLWIAETSIGTGQYSDASVDPVRDQGPLFSLIYLQRPPGYTTVGYRFIEMVAQDAVQDGYLLTEDVTQYVWLDIGEPAYNAGQRIIICEDEQLFLAENPNSTAVTTVEEPDAAFWDSLDPAGGQLGFMRVNNPTEPWLSHRIAWGNVAQNDPIRVPTNPVPTPWDGEFPDETYEYPYATTAPAPGPGQYLRYAFSGASTDPAAYWSLVESPNVGYEIGDYLDSEDAPNQGQLTIPYLKIDLTPMFLQIVTDITDAVPGAGEELPVQMPDGELTTAGLDDSGTIQIGGEQMTYSSKTDTALLISGRGTGGTTAAEHDALDQIQQVIGGIATNANAIDKVGWVRTNDPYPADFDVYYTTNAEARLPGSSRWEDDWPNVLNVTGHAAQIWEHDFDPSVRIRSVLFTFHAMSTDPARVRINEVTGLMDPDKFDDDWDPDPIESETLITNILVDAGVPNNVIFSSSLLPMIYEINVDRGNLWDVVTGLAEYVGGQLSVDLFSRIYIQVNEALIGAAVFARNWSETNARDITPNWSQATVSQVKLSWIDDAQDAKEQSAIYPAAPASTGAAVEMGPYLLTDQAIANRAAERLYEMRRYPYTHTVTANDGDLAVKPLEIGNVSWNLHDESADITRDVVVTDVTHEWSKHAWTTTLIGLQFRRESES